MWYFLWFFACLVVSCGGAVPDCDDFFERDSPNEFAIIVPKNTKKEIRVKVVYRFPKRLEDFQKSEYPRISLTEESNNHIWRDIANGNPIRFKITYRNRLNNYPKIGQVSLGDVVKCKNLEGSNFSNFLSTLTRYIHAFCSSSRFQWC